jgi:alpha-tubulin suppressor-like RCC1 family protein
MKRSLISLLLLTATFGTAVIASADTATRISAGKHHACALTSGGAVWCWGDNGHGQLGDGTTTNRWVATPVSGLESGVTAIAAGTFHTCALMEDASCAGEGTSAVSSATGR